MSSNSFINALQAMDLAQMVVQAVWNTDSPLRQIPHFTKEVIDRCQAADVKDVADIPELEDADRTKLLQMNNRQLADVARFCNNFPDLEITHEVQDEGELSAGTPINVVVNIEREIDDDVDGSVSAPFYPGTKTENWWLVATKPATKQLLAIRKLPFKRSYDPTKLSFELPQGKHDIQILLVSDSYISCDKSIDISLDVKEGEDSDEDDSDEDMEE
jgi:pre-mRNA-splicing helicase BRR2